MELKQNIFHVDEFKNWINRQLARTDDFANDSFKAGLCEALKHISLKCKTVKLNFMEQKQNIFNVIEFKNWINQQLAQTEDFANDSYKAGLCEALEHVLLKCKRYKGYNDNYWQHKGFAEWIKAGKPEDDPLKDKFIYGPTGQKFNRCYY